MRAEADPLPVVADLLVATVTLAAGTVSMGTEDHDRITLRKPGRGGHPCADPLDRPGNLVAGRGRELHRKIAVEVPVDELKIGAAHARAAHLDEYLSGLDIGDRDLFESQRLLVPVHARGPHRRHGFSS